MVYDRADTFTDHVSALNGSEERKQGLRGEWANSEHCRTVPHAIERRSRRSMDGEPEAV